MKLDPKKIPKCCTHLIPLAEKWGVGDDVEREQAVAHASVAELSQLVDAIQALPDDEMYAWLAGPESYNTHPTDEYVAFTCMTMAYDSARVRSKTKENTEPDGGEERR